MSRFLSHNFVFAVVSVRVSVRVLRVLYVFAYLGRLLLSACQGGTELHLGQWAAAGL
jgi:hypothetical protein